MVKQLRRLLLGFLIAGIVSANADAFLANPATAQADRYALFYVEQTAPLLNSIFSNIESFYVQNNRCPSTNTFALNVSGIPTIKLATNNQCVAFVTFASEGVSPLIAGRTVAVGPSWIAATNTWGFSLPMIASDINNQQDLQSPLKTCDPLNLLSKSNSFISAYYSATPVSTLQDPNNTCRTTGIAGV